ncbi:hypothetical protein N431DRAFT_347037 [Stipitochalara longipes BDJ]|nr:hypothetical protein N431DRAFT_347037 [Stipitochalara longipes BDJ]
MDAFSDVRPVPLSVILSWPKPNYVDPIRRGPALVIVNSLLLPVALVIVGLRLYTRLVICRSAGLDDLFIALAAVPAIGLTIAVCLAASRYSWDVHIWDVPLQNIIPSRQVTFTAQFLFLWATNLTKISILLFYRRLSAPSMKKIFDYCVCGTLAFVVCYTIALSIALLKVCTPLAGFWDVSVPHHCIDQIKFELAAAMLNIIIDFVIMVLPLPTIWSLQLPKRQKWALSGVFMLGMLVCIAGAIRAYYIDVLVSKTYDTTWEGFMLWIFVALEVDIALICASAPVLKPLFRRYLNSSSNSTGSHGFHKRSSKNPQHRVESGVSFQDAFQVPVELGSVDHAKISGENQKPLPPVPESDTGIVLRKDDNSDESVFIIQQMEVEERKPAKACGSRSKNGERCQKLNELWARKEPWSGV